MFGTLSFTFLLHHHHPTQSKQHHLHLCLSIQPIIIWLDKICVNNVNNQYTFILNLPPFFSFPTFAIEVSVWGYGGLRKGRSLMHEKQTNPTNFKESFSHRRNPSVHKNFHLRYVVRKGRGWGRWGECISLRPILILWMDEYTKEETTDCFALWKFDCAQNNFINFPIFHWRLFSFPSALILWTAMRMAMDMYGWSIPPHKISE